ncbi:MAG: helix-turn-helix domain-containing protein [Bacteroidales bacterium]|nr:helix-turn-helix domain-containing protein [Bacteroidales bacterium]
MEINVEKLFFGNDSTYITKHYQQYSFTSPRHYHYEYEIAFIEKSRGKLFVGNTVVNFNPGDLFLFAPRLVHAFKNSVTGNKKNRSAKATIILFKNDFFGKDFLERNEARELKDLLIRAEEGIKFTDPDQEVVSAILKLSDKKGLKGILDFISILSYLASSENYNLLSLKFYKKYYYSLKEERLYKILELVDRNYPNDSVFEEAIRMTNMHKSVFSRYFKQKTEITFTKYLNDIRIMNVQKYLIETNMRIIDICYKCGFNNLTYFNRFFKKVNGITPRQFRRLYLGANRGMVEV